MIYEEEQLGKKKKGNGKYSSYIKIHTTPSKRYIFAYNKKDLKF